MISTTPRTRSSLPTRISLGWLAVALAAGSTGCADRDADARRMVSALSSARDRVCACADLACAEAVEQELADYLLLHVDRFKKIPRPARGSTDELGTTAARLDGELRTCLQHLAGSTRPS